LTERLTVEQVVQINAFQCEATGENSALLDPDGLEAAVERPWGGFGETEFFPTLYEKAAALLHGIAARQVFENGNKRTAWVAAATLLDINGIDLGAVETIHAEALVLRLPLTTRSALMGLPNGSASPPSRSCGHRRCH